MNPFLSGLNRFGRRFMERQLTVVAELFQKGIAGDKQAVEAAYQYLGKLRQRFSKDNLVEAYYGSVLALKGRDAIEPFERLDYVRQGLKLLDEAVHNEPDNVMIRSLRGYVCYRLPEVFFHRTATGVEDFRYLVERYEKDPKSISEDFYRQLKRDLAAAQKTLKRAAEAREKGKKEGVQL